MINQINDMKFYTSFDTIPIYNWHKIATTGDFRYILKDVDYDNLPDFEKDEYRLLVNAYDVLISNIKEITNTLQLKFLTALKSYFDAKDLPELETKANMKFTEYLKELDNNFTQYNIENQIFSKAADAYNYFKQGKDWQFIFTRRYIVFDYRVLNKKEKREWILYNDILLIKKALNIDIDEFKTSVSKFNHLKEKALKLIQDGRKHD